MITHNNVELALVENLALQLLQVHLKGLSFL